MLSLVISHTLIVVMRPDQQDYEGTGITIKVARQLEVPHIMIVVNKTPNSLTPEAIKAKVETAYQCSVAAVLPHSEEMMDLASGGVFVTRFPNDPMTSLFENIATKATANYE